MSNNIITVSCWRASSEWKQKDAETLATAVVQPAALRPLSLMDLFQQAASQGAVVSEFASIWQYSEYVRRVETALQNGDLAGATALLAVCPVAFTENTLAVLQATLARNVLRLVDVVAAEQRTVPPTVAPAAVTAADVTAALEEAGYVWIDNQWSRL